MGQFAPETLVIATILRARLCYFVAQGDSAMANTVVRARIDEHVKGEAAAVLATIGLTVSDAFRLMMMRIAKDKALPFEPLVPNAETVEAMKAARRGELMAVGSPARLTRALLETARDMKDGGVLTERAHQKITRRHLGKGKPSPMFDAPQA